MFNLEVGDAPHKATGEKEEEVNHNKLEDMIKELATTLKTVKHEQEYMQVWSTKWEFSVLVSTQLAGSINGNIDELISRGVPVVWPMASLQYVTWLAHLSFSKFTCKITIEIYPKLYSEGKHCE